MTLLLGSQLEQEVVSIEGAIDAFVAECINVDNNFYMFSSIT